MLVDDVGDVTVTNDGATILKLLEVEHPAAKVLVELAQLQDEEVGDGTTSVVIIAAELLKNADELVKQKIHPTSIMAGYRLACKEAVKYIQVFILRSVKISQIVSKISIFQKLQRNCDFEFSRKKFKLFRRKKGKKKEKREKNRFVRNHLLF